MIRLFHPLPEPHLTLAGERHHYLTRVLRLMRGDTLEVFDGKGKAFAAKVQRVDEDSSLLELGAAQECVAGRHLTLIQGLPKGDKWEWIIQKATELGVSALAPVETVRSVVKVDPSKTENKTKRWQKIAEEAARQSGRRDVPVVHAVTSLMEAVQALAPGTQLLTLDEEERAVSLSQALKADVPLALIIGPEGGLDRSEVQGQPVSLGQLILRTETASVAALCVVLHRDGRLG
ncbi:MAG: RsmE family RNA methyltransferase [Myxococcaceae bacterium]